MLDDCDAILHIGAGKSGSSAIQTFLRTNFQQLSDNGVIVPNQNLMLASPISGHSVFRLQQIFDDQGKGIFFNLNRLMKSIGNARLLISAENMSNAEHYRYFTQFGSTFSVKAIFYIRRQDDYFASAWQQWNSKVRSDLDNWLGEARRDQAHWLKTIENWESVLGKGNVIPRIFERQSLPNGDVVQDFVDVLGLPKASFTFETDDVNKSHDNLVTMLVQGRRDLFEGPHDDAFYRFVASLRKGDGTKGLSLISRSQREAILTHYADENEELRKRFFPERTTLFAPIDHSSYRYADEEDLQQETISMLLDIVSEAFKQRSGIKE